MNHEERISLEVLPINPPSTTNMNIMLDIPTILTCPICLTDYQTSEIISGCSQKHHFCKAYFDQHLEHLISESVLEIRFQFFPEGVGRVFMIFRQKKKISDI